MNNRFVEQSDQIHRATLQFLRSLQASGITDWPPSSDSGDLELVVRESAFTKDSLAGEKEAGIEASPGKDAGKDAGKEATHTPPEPTPVENKGFQDSSALFKPGSLKPGSLKPGSLKPGSQPGYARQPLSVRERSDQLDVLKGEVEECTACEQLVECRTQTVFGVGNPQPRLCFFGEGPGADEDRLGEPFVGRAGELLNKIIEACQMRREDVYILNTVKCRPPGNRNPLDQEIDNCWPFAEAQLEILQPEFICCLGAVAARTLLRTNDSVGRLRQKFHQYRDSQVIVTYHPAYLLRTPAAKGKTWDDLKMLMDAMGIARQSD